MKKDLIDMFELDKLPGDKTEEMVERLGRLIFQATLVRSIPLLSEENQKEYEKLIDSEKGGDEMFKFLQEKVPGFENILKEESEALRLQMSEGFSESGLE
ncbi:MAG: hypothetical protein O210_OD1C00001G0555 [Parcubacteria bacterium RAAC4_OD1_1]|nr:MAG: hypothetical protein O210_OD1C00001G0555 [Parcubacteria bacterium RAAC4_OD1_1]